MTESYHDLPLLKPPVWTWEVPAYFFVGGAAGAAAVLGAAAQMAGAEEKLVRDARWIAAIGAGLSAPLLIADLGRPERFLNMLRVFKPQSPMSVGAWTVAVFGGATTAAVFLPNKSLQTVAGWIAAATGLVMSTYTGVLIGATAIPVWKEHVRLLPVHFGASALGSAVSLLELRGHEHPALQSLGLGASIFESLTGSADFQSAAPPASSRQDAGGPADWKSALRKTPKLMHLSGALAGPIPFALRLLGARKTAAASTLLGSLLTRFAWVAAGKASAADVHIALGEKRA